MTWGDFLRLQDDGCPNAHEHLLQQRLWEIWIKHEFFTTVIQVERKPGVLDTGVLDG